MFGASIDCFDSLPLRGTTVFDFVKGDTDRVGESPTRRVGASSRRQDAGEKGFDKRDAVGSHLGELLQEIDHALHAHSDLGRRRTEHNRRDDDLPFRSGFRARAAGTGHQAPEGFRGAGIISSPFRHLQAHRFSGIVLHPPSRSRALQFRLRAQRRDHDTHQPIGGADSARPASRPRAHEEPDAMPAPITPAQKEPDIGPPGP
jgi:hypothetical protein